MKIGLISDTHGQLELAQAAAREFIIRSVDAVIHCGDIGSDLVLLASADLYRELDIPVYAVLGNCDHDNDYRGLPGKMTVRIFGRFGELDLAGRALAFLHGDNETQLLQAVQCGRYDYVFCGHSHARRDEMIGTTRVINPGSAGRGMHPSCAVLDLEKGTVSFFRIKK